MTAPDRGSVCARKLGQNLSLRRGKRVDPLCGMGVRAAVSVRCPQCDAEDATSIVRTRESTYYRCQGCGNFWREERTDPLPDTGQRRRETDGK